MSFDWHDYWLFAEQCQLQANSMVSTEATLRASISRAYYSVFCRARNLAATRGVTLSRSGNTHYLVSRYFEQGQSVFEQKLGKDLQLLRWYRNQADYNDSFPGDLARTAQFVITRSKELHAILAKLP